MGGRSEFEDAALSDIRRDVSARVCNKWYVRNEGSYVDCEDAMLSDSRWDESARVCKNWYGHSWGDTFDPVRKRWYRRSWDWPIDGITNPDRYTFARQGRGNSGGAEGVMAQQRMFGPRVQRVCTLG